MRYDPNNVLPERAAKHYFESTARAVLEDRLRSCGEVPLEDLTVTALEFKEQSYSKGCIEVFCELAFGSDAITRYAEVARNSAKAMELCDTMEAIHQELTAINDQGFVFHSCKGTCRLVFHYGSMNDGEGRYYITDTNRKQVEIAIPGYGSPWLIYGERYLMVNRDRTIPQSLQKSRESRQAQTEPETTAPVQHKSTGKTYIVPKSSTDSDTTTRQHDPYDVYDYIDAEDFYFDHEEDFDDFEDAEDYFDEARDE